MLLRHATWPMGRLAGLALAVSLAWPAQAQLFGDNEARRAILELREKVELNQHASESADRQLKEALDKLENESANPTRRSLLDLSNQLESLRSELASLRGQNEQLMRDVAQLQQQQKESLTAVSSRLSSLEPTQVQQDGLEFTAQPAEKRDFDAAMAVLRQTEYPRAAQLYQQFMSRYPESAYTPSALYWLGNTQYALREYKNAIASYQKMLKVAPSHPRVPEAQLAIANCQLELKDASAARKTLEALAKAYPKTEAGATAKDRLSRLR